MDLSEADGRLLNLWQRLRLRSEPLEVSPSARADAFRGLLVQLQYLNRSGKISKACYSNLLNQYASKYSGLIDDCDSSKGLNNFAEPVLSLASGQRNESQEWKSSLTVESVAQSSLWEKLENEESQVSAPEQMQIRAGTKKTTHLDKRRVFPTVNNNLGGAVLPVDDLPEVVAVPFGGRVTTADTNSLENFSRNVRVGSTSTEVVGVSSNEVPRSSIVLGSLQGFSSSSSDREFPRAERNQQPVLMDSTRFVNKRKASALYPDVSVEDHRQHPVVPNQPRAQSSVFKTQDLSSYPGNSGKPLHRNFPYQGNRFQEQTPAQQFGQNQNFAREWKRGNAQYQEEIDELSVKEGEAKGREGPSPFVTAREQYMIDCKKKKTQTGTLSNANYGSGKRTLGIRRGPSSKFVPPILGRNSDDEGGDGRRSQGQGGAMLGRRGPGSGEEEPEMDERLKNIEPKMVELITNEIMDHGPPVAWSDIAGLDFAKNVIKEIVVWPMLRPDIFKGLRGPPKGLLLFGPPGTGKTLIGKCIASQSKATFFSISASSLTSKWVGEGEKMVRALFAVARCNLPAVIFIDEIDSLLSQRTDGEHDASRRIKTEFLVQLDGAATNSDERVLVVGATNRPQEIDEAARRRLVKRLYIPLPEADARRQIIQNLLAQQSYQLSDDQLEEIVRRSDGYSGADMSNLCREAALGPIRSISGADIQHISADQVRPIVFEDFDEAFGQVRASVSQKDLDIYVEWNRLYGSRTK